MTATATVTKPPCAQCGRQQDYTFHNRTAAQCDALWGTSCPSPGEHHAYLPTLDADHCTKCGVMLRGAEAGVCSNCGDGW